MKILMTNDEWNRSGWFPKLVAIITGNIVLFLALGALILLPLFVLYGLTIIPLKIYLAMIVVILLVVVFRKTYQDGPGSIEILQPAKGAGFRMTRGKIRDRRNVPSNFASQPREERRAAHTSFVRARN